MKHVSETELSLYVGGELGFWAQRSVRSHLGKCPLCREECERFASAREAMRGSSDLPAGFDWERVAAEMTANIHLGLAAGECVTPARPAPAGYGYLGGWQRPAVVFAGTVLAVFLAWFVYTQKPAEIVAEAVTEGITVESTPHGIELNDNGRVFGLRHASDSQVVGVSLRGSLQARYVDSETGQVTINNVYVP